MTDRNKDISIGPLIDTLIEINECTRDNSSRRLLGDSRYIEECCTVRINIGRQKGHTTYIAKRLTDKDIVVVDTICNFKDNITSIMESVGNESNVDRVLTIDEVVHGDIPNHIDIDNIKRVYVDLAFNVHISNIRRRFAGVGSIPTIVILGI